MKHWTILPVDEAAVSHLEAVLKIPRVLCRLLVQRGVCDFETARAFFRPDLAQLHDPFLMQDMAAAVQRLRRAIVQGEGVLLYGDYDVDGTTSVAMMHSFLAPLVARGRLGFYIPDRYAEGYGVSLAGVDHAVAQGAALMIVMDCGVRAHEQIAYARSKGVDVIVCDHHRPEGVLPVAVAVLDPKRADCAYPYKELSGCGVAFKLVQAYCRAHELGQEYWWPLLDLVAVSIASDIVAMDGENRVLAYFGLQVLNDSPRLGLRMLMKLSRREGLWNVKDIVYGLAPLINAAGRLADAHQAVRLMLAEEDAEAAAYVGVLEQRNQLRKEFDQRIAGEARALFEGLADWPSRSSVVLYQPHWHKGVVGIVAARMVERYHRPAVILAESGGKVVGSARSVLGFDVHEALKACSSCLVNYGGHKYAAGLTLLPEQVPAFQARFEAYAQAHLGREPSVPQVLYGAEIDLAEIDDRFLRILRQFEPFGPANRNPVFLTRGVSDAGYARVLREVHLSMVLWQGANPSFGAMAFGAASAHGERVLAREPFDMCYTIEEHQWQGKMRLQLMVKDMG